MELCDVSAHRCSCRPRPHWIRLYAATGVAGLEEAEVKRTFILAHPQARHRAVEAVRTAPEGYRVDVAEPTRNGEQNAKFHAMCSDIAKSGLEWAGKKRTADQWKVLLVSGHATATKEGAEMVPGLEGEFVNVRESTALMSVRRSSSLIEYTVAFCAMNGVPLNEATPSPTRAAALSAAHH